ncbi:MAG: rhomboid family intramembrane serine protease [Mycobacteriaceae bacterium]|nr:rhomboid family intramembrane serine protease [Mycobacteriaceae bacterium]
MVIPVHDLNPVRRTPWVTYALIAVNVIVFLRTPALPWSFSGNGSLADMCHLQAFQQQWGAVPRELIRGIMPKIVPTGDSGVSDTGQAGCVIGPPGYDKSPPLSALTAMFLHGSWMHLLGNMLFLWIFGNNVEDRMGRVRYLLFYLLCGFAATYGFALAQPDSTQTLIGASGAIAGVLGAYIVLWPKARVWSLITLGIIFPVKLPAWVVLGLWFALQAVYSAGGGVEQGTVAYVAHVVGFVVGALVALPLRRHTAPLPPQPSRYRSRPWQPPPPQSWGPPPGPQ